jgi:hypothetical protein
VRDHPARQRCRARAVGAALHAALQLARERVGALGFSSVAARCCSFSLSS